MLRSCLKVQYMTDAQLCHLKRCLCSAVEQRHLMNCSLVVEMGTCKWRSLDVLIQNVIPLRRSIWSSLKCLKLHFAVLCKKCFGKNGTKYPVEPFIMGILSARIPLELSLKGMTTLQSSKTFTVPRNCPRDGEADGFISFVRPFLT